MATYYSTADLDALIKGTLTKDLSLDSLLKAAQTKGLDLDSLLLRSVRLPKGFFAQDYTGQVGSIVHGNYVIGDSSGAIAVLVGLIDNGATGTFFFDVITGTFQAGETLYKGTLGSDLITNGDMEIDDNWESYGSDLSSFSNTYSTVRANSPTHSRLLYDSGLPAGSRVGVQSDEFATTLDEFYVVGFAANPDYADDFSVVMKSGSGIIGHLFDYPYPTLDIWTEYEFIYQETLGGGSKARFMFLSESGWTGSWRYYLDDVYVLPLTKDLSNYATANGATYSPTPHLDALLTKSQSVGVGLDAELTLGIRLADPAYLSEMQIEASFGNRMEVEGKLSGIALESRFGMRAKDPLNLSVLGCEATISTPGRISVDAKLSVLESDSRFGMRAKDNLKFSALAIEAEISGASQLAVDQFLSPMEIEAAISTPGKISVDKLLSALESEITISREQVITLDKNLSALQIEAAIGTGAIEVDSKLSALGIEATISNREIAIDSKLSAMEIVAVLEDHGIHVDSDLSALIIAASITNNEFNIDSKLSALEVVATLADYGIHVDSNLSALSIEATIVDGRKIYIDSKISALAIEAAINSRDIIVDSKLSALVVDAAIENREISVDSNLAAMGIEALISSDAENVFSIDSKISVLQSDISISSLGQIEIEANLSGLFIEANILSGGLISVDEKLSVMGIEANIIWSNVPIVVDAMLSALIMEGIGTGSDSDGATATIKEAGRFDNYTLRHSRW